MSKKTLSKLLRKVKDLNNTCQKTTNTKEELEIAIILTLCKYKDIIFGNDTHICRECLNELKRSINSLESA